MPSWPSCLQIGKQQITNSLLALSLFGCVSKVVNLVFLFLRLSVPVRILHLVNKYMTLQYSVLVPLSMRRAYSVICIYNSDLNQSYRVFYRSKKYIMSEYCFQNLETIQKLPNIRSNNEPGQLTPEKAYIRINIEQVIYFYFYFRYFSQFIARNLLVMLKYI